MSTPKPEQRPRIALTMGDAAGVGPELIVQAWTETELHRLARPIVLGNAEILKKAAALVGSPITVQAIREPEESVDVLGVLSCLDPTGVELDSVSPGGIDARAGRAAHDYLIAAADLALAGRIDAVTTLPLHKEALHAAGVDHPGHTEILAERCHAPDHAMMLYLAPDQRKGTSGFGVLHATLHVALRRVFDLLSEELVEEKIRLADRAFRPLIDGRSPRIAVAALNPHAGEGGLFGDEETRWITPAVERTRADGLHVVGPLAADTLFARALAGEFDIAVAMYHDQGHVALKTIGFDRAVNVTLGLPIIRTSVAHGTAFDIAWKGVARTASLLEAVRVAARLAAYRGLEACPRNLGAVSVS